MEPPLERKKRTMIVPKSMLNRIFFTTPYFVRCTPISVLQESLKRVVLPSHKNNKAFSEETARRQREIEESMN